MENRLLTSDVFEVMTVLVLMENYPFITDGDWHIVFWYDIFAEGEGTCSIKIYKTVLNEPDISEAKPKEMKAFLPSDLDLDCEGDYWDELADVRKLVWSNEIFNDKTGKYLGRISLMNFPDLHTLVTGFMAG